MYKHSIILDVPISEISTHLSV